jgi:hypothetical protein
MARAGIHKTKTSKKSRLCVDFFKTVFINSFLEGLGQVPNFSRSRLALYLIWEEGGEERERVKVKRRRKGDE